MRRLPGKLSKWQDSPSLCYSDCQLWILQTWKLKPGDCKLWPAEATIRKQPLVKIDSQQSPKETSFLLDTAGCGHTVLCAHRGSRVAVWGVMWPLRGHFLIHRSKTGCWWELCLGCVSPSAPRCQLGWRQEPYCLALSIHCHSLHTGPKGMVCETQGLLGSCWANGSRQSDLQKGGHVCLLQTGSEHVGLSPGRN